MCQIFVLFGLIHSNHFPTKFITDFYFLPFKLAYLHWKNVATIKDVSKDKILISKDIDIYIISQHFAKTVAIAQPYFLFMLASNKNSIFTTRAVNSK